MNQLQQFQFVDKYSRWDHDKGRRETWEEAIQRAVDYLKELSHNRLSDRDYNAIKHAMLHMRAFPSMRLFAMAGEAARRNNASIYNCSYLPMDSPDALCEVLLLSMSGVGVGYSVEKDYIEKWPIVKHGGTSAEVPTYLVPDDTEGWVAALRVGLYRWIDGYDIEFDYSQVRPAGSILRVKGGRASGPEPLKRLLDGAKKIVLGASGRRLTSLEVYDMATLVGDCAVSGGSRRSAQICLFDHDDYLMLNAKANGFWETAPQRVNANNSAVWHNGMRGNGLIDAMFAEGNGEPGIFSREAAKATMPERRDKSYDFGGNPCLEIYLRPRQFCNLSQAILRSDDDYDSLKEKVRIATIIGTIQSMATYFPGLPGEWKRNTEEERLLGVDITGQMDNPGLMTPSVLDSLREYAVNVNQAYARKLGIQPSAAVTCVKPSGNSSVLFDCSPGLHARWSPYYIRRVRVNAHSPVRQLLEISGVKLTPENGQNYETASTMVAAFPVKSPDGAVTQQDLSARDQLEWWAMNKRYWTEHNPSCTITYQPHERQEVQDWIEENRGIIGGLSFLPKFTDFYPQMPIEAITKEEYEMMLAEMPEVDWSNLCHFEKEDHTEAAQLLACGISGDDC